jgi:predicted PurR-regulated permease PerM
VYTLYIGQEIIIPIVCSFLISVLLTPVVNFMVRRKVSRIFAITIAIVAAFLLAAGLVYFIASQLSMFDRALPTMREKLNSLQYQASQWISIHFNISIQRIDAWFMKTRGDILANGNSMVGKTLVTISGFLIAVFIVPVYVFMKLYYEPL